MHVHRLGDADRAIHHYKLSRNLANVSDTSRAQALQTHVSMSNEARKMKDWSALLKLTQGAISAGADSAPQVLMLHFPTNLISLSLVAVTLTLFLLLLLLLHFYCIGRSLPGKLRPSCICTDMKRLRQYWRGRPSLTLIHPQGSSVLPAPHMFLESEHKSIYRQEG